MLLKFKDGHKLQAFLRDQVKRILPFNMLVLCILMKRLKGTAIHIQCQLTMQHLMSVCVAGPGCTYV